MASLATRPNRSTASAEALGCVARRRQALADLGGSTGLSLAVVPVSGLISGVLLLIGGTYGEDQIR